MTAPTTDGTPAPSVEHRDWQDWVRTNVRRVGLGAGAVVIVAGAVLAYLASERRKEAFASQALAQAWATVEAGNMPLAANDLARLVERFSGTRSADEAAILLNEIRLLNGETEAAVRGLQDFVRKSRAGYLDAAAWSLLGGGLENQGKYREAAAAYRRAVEQAELAFLKAQYLLDAGRAFALAGDTASARSAFAEILSNHGSLAQASEARVRMAEVGGEVPAPPERAREGGAPTAS
jgi:predicted negative regulator of RcsB-dependent stress response